MNTCLLNLKMSQTAKYIKYVKSWENDPVLKEWIAPMVGDIKSAYCKVCRRPLHPHKKDLLLHAKAKKHIKNLERYRELFSSCQPLKDAELGDGTYEFMPSEIKLELKNQMQSTSPLKKTPKKNVTIAVFPESQEVIHDDSLLQIKSLPEDEINDTASIIISDDPSVMSSNPCYQWKNIPEFRGWLEVEENRIYCKICDKELKPNKTEIYKHSILKLHQKKCLKNGITVVEAENDIELSLLYNRDTFQRTEKVIDMRSDSITQPNKEMKKAMLFAELGDDSFGDDPTVKELETKVANFLDKECALLLPSGTMANLVAVMTHCWSRDSKVFVGDESHIYKWSQGGLARLAGIETRPLPNMPDGSFSIQQLNLLLKENEQSPWMNQLLVCIENSHNRMGGRALPVTWLEQLGEFCVDNGIILHMDGARLLNASIACGVSPANLIKYCASSSFCLNKGLGAPMGSVLVGSREFVERAKRVRSMLGGTMHQAGIFAAAALYALENIAPKLHWDHANARAIAQSVTDIHSSAVTTDMNNVQTNFVHLKTDNIRVNAKDFCERLSTIKEREFRDIGEEVKVLMLPISDTVVRFVTHYDLSKCDVELVIRKLKLVIEEYDNMLELNFDKRI